MNFARNFKYAILPLFIGLFLTINARAAGEVDLSFNGSAQRAVNGGVLDSYKQSDGKVILGGNFTAINGFAANCVARLNVDGSIDTTFNNAPDYLKLTYVYAVAVQSDGKILVGVKGQYVTGIRRLNVDGSEDTTFTNINLNSGNDIVNEIEILPDGRFLVGGRLSSLSAQTGGANIARFNSNGAYDNTFSTNFTGIINDIEVLADGRILISGNYSNQSQGFLVRLLANGAVDGTFGIIGANFAVGAIKVQADGKIVFSGSFSIVNGDDTKKGIVRASSDGILDSSFNTNTTGSFGGAGSFLIRPDGKLVVGGTYYANAGGTRRLVLLNTDGSLDASFTANLPVNAGVSTMVQYPDGRILLGFFGNATDGNGLLRINADGSTDTSITYYTSRLGSARKVLEQPDGKVLVVGEFKVANNTPRPGIVRYNADGTLDTAFNPPISPYEGYAVALQPDGKILYGTNSGGIFRLNTDGSVDASFTTPAITGIINDIAVLANGEIIAAGYFRTGSSGSFVGLKKFSSNGSAATFNANFQSSVNKVYPLPTGKILVGGGEGFFRINADGTQDTTFSADRFSVISDIDVQADGKIIAVGNFTGLAGNNSQKNIGRVSADGYSDPTFAQSTDGQLFGVKVQPDGKILVAGGMAFVGGIYHPGMVRLQSNGSVDGSFTANTNDNVFDVALLSTGKIFITGIFTRVNGISRVSVARLNDSVVPARTPFDFDGDGRTDIVTYRPSNSVWYQLLGSNYQYSAVGFGISEDIVAPADFDGDGKTDIGVFRPSTGVWWYRSSAQSNSFRAVQWGQSGDIPLPSDFNGDGKDDFVVYRPSNSTWYRLTDTGVSSTLAFGVSGDKPLIGDFDGDGKADPAIFRPSTGAWWYASSAQANTFRAVQFGTNGDIPAAADFDGDRKTDFAVFRPSTGVWYVLNSGNNSATIVQFGTNDDKPVAGDYDGDGKADIAVYRPSNGSWYILRTSAGFAGVQFGAGGDVPVPNAFLR